MKYCVIGRILAGWHATTRTEKNKTGGGTIRGHSTGATLQAYLSDAEEGALVYDGSEVADAIALDFVCKSPMLNPDLAPEHEKEGIRPLAYVGVQVYKRLLREVPGMRVGVVCGGTIIWE